MHKQLHLFMLLISMCALNAAADTKPDAASVAQIYTLFDMHHQLELEATHERVGFEDTQTAQERITDANAKLLLTLKKRASGENISSTGGTKQSIEAMPISAILENNELRITNPDAQDVPKCITLEHLSLLAYGGEADPADKEKGIINPRYNAPHRYILLSVKALERHITFPFAKNSFKLSEKLCLIPHEQCDLLKPLTQEAINTIAQHEESPMLMIDIKAWLDYRYSQEEQELLPCKEVHASTFFAGSKSHIYMHASRSQLKALAQQQQLIPHHEAKK